MARNLEELVDKRVAEWNARRKATPGPENPLPKVITIGRDKGSGGEAVAHALAERLGWRVYDQEIVDAIAEQARVRNALVESLDERTRSGIKDTLTPLFEADEFSYSEYLHHLTQVLLALAHSGDAIIVGRGAHFAIPPHMRLAVRLHSAAPVRVARVMELDGLDRAEAEGAVRESDEARLAFAKRHFGQDPRDPVHYHMVVDAHAMTFHAATEAIAAGFRAWDEATRPAAVV